MEEAWRREYRIQLETPRLLLRPVGYAGCGRFLWDGASALTASQMDLMRSRFGHWAIQDQTTGVIHGWTELSKLHPWWGRRTKSLSATSSA